MGITASAAKVAASTMPALVITPPVNRKRITDDILRAAGVDVAQFRGSLRVLIRAMDPAAPRVETTTRG